MTAVIFAAYPSQSGAAPADQKKYLEKQYAPSSRWVPVKVEYKGEMLEFRAQIAKDRPRIAVDASEATADKTSTGVVGRLTFNLLDRRLDRAPFEQAALLHLANTKRTNCVLSSGTEIVSNTFEWNFECSPDRRREMRRH